MQPLTNEHSDDHSGQLLESRTINNYTNTKNNSRSPSYNAKKKFQKEMLAKRYKNSLITQKVLSVYRIESSEGSKWNLPSELGDLRKVYEVRVI